MVAPPKPTPITLGKAIDIYLDTCKIRINMGTLTQATLNTYAQTLHKFATHLGENMLVDDITGQDIDGAIATYVNSPDQRRTHTHSKPKSLASQRTYWSALSAFFTEAELRSWVQVNPLNYVTLKPALPKKTSNPKRSALTVEQAQAILDYGAGEPEETGSPLVRLSRIRDKAILALLLSTGSRNSELTGANLEDFTPTPTGAKWKIQGKGNKERTIPLTSGAWALYLDYQAARKHAVARGFFKEPPNPHRAFISSRGLPLDPRAIQRLAEKAHERVGGNPATSHLARAFVPHALRHTNATILLRGGDASLPQVRDLLGHVNVSITSLYLDSDDASLEAVVNSNPVK